VFIELMNLGDISCTSQVIAYCLKYRWPCNRGRLW